MDKRLLLGIVLPALLLLAGCGGESDSTKCFREIATEFCESKAGTLGSLYSPDSYARPGFICLIDRLDIPPEGKFRFTQEDNDLCYK